MTASKVWLEISGRMKNWKLKPAWNASDNVATIQAYGDDRVADDLKVVKHFALTKADIERAAKELFVADGVYGHFLSVQNINHAGMLMSRSREEVVAILCRELRIEK